MDMRFTAAIVSLLLVLAQITNLTRSQHGAGIRAQARTLGVQLAAAQSNFETYLGATYAALGPNKTDRPIVAPTSMPTTPACASAPCTYNVGADFAIVSNALGTSNPSANDTSYNLQRQSLIAQNVLSAKITAYVWPSNGGVPASRCVMFTYRVMGQSPYYELTGQTDCGGSAQVALERDSGGCNPSSPASCDPTGATQTTPSDTIDHAYTQCVDYNGWSCQGQGPVSVDNTATNTWQNANQKTGWGSH